MRSSFTMKSSGPLLLSTVIIIKKRARACVRTEEIDLNNQGLLMIRESRDFRKPISLLLC